MMLHLVRHPPVAKTWQKRCYGQSDPGLSCEGRAMVEPLVDQLAAQKPDLIVHSNMARTRSIANLLARRLGIPCVSEPLWRERHFGSWEGQSWNAIYQSTGSAMDGMIDDPSGFRPGGDGETTVELVRRTLAAMRKLPSASFVVVISHGGPIAAARMLTDKANFSDLPQLIVRTASFVRVAAKKLAVAISTPCIRLCLLDGQNAGCVGCLRTMEEIGRWANLDDGAKAAMIETLSHRRG